MSATEHVILVDENDKEVGIAEKIQAHRENLRHRAFSVFVFKGQKKRELLLQQRAEGKYHSAKLWTNTCCSHPRPGENILAAGERRLFEEVGIHAKLSSLGWFHYVAPFENGLTENEIDYVLVGSTEEKNFQPNPDEVKALRWITLDDLNLELQNHPEKFTPWFAKAWEIVKKEYISLSS